MTQKELHQCSLLLNLFMKDHLPSKTKNTDTLFGEKPEKIDIERNRNVDNVLMTRFLVCEELNKQVNKRYNL